MAGMIIDVIAGKPKGEPMAEEEPLEGEAAPAAEPAEGGAEALISSIEAQLAELRTMMADLG